MFHTQAGRDADSEIRAQYDFALRGEGNRETSMTDGDRSAAGTHAVGVRSSSRFAIN
ncbi:hypothetical protein RP20_CCG004157 [Aedes albopictus]|nr:hypothetical protein RP20_CCG004157 [Aedes albopictus]